MALHLVTGYKGIAHVTSADMGALNAALIGKGDYVCKTGKMLEAQALTNNKVRILDGDLLIQGRHVNLAVDTYEDITIENGMHGLNRNDLIVCRYEKDAASGTENAIFVVIKGVETSGTASDPAVTTGNILSGALLHEMPLYRVKIEGISLVKIESLFSYRSSISELTASEIGAAKSSHGNHVPTIQTADNKKFLRNDNTWQPVTPANIGAASSSHSHAVSDINAGTLGVARGGTGATTFASGAALIGNGTGAVTTRVITDNTTTAVASGTNLATCNTVNNHVANRQNRTNSVNSANTSYSTYMARGIALVTAVPTSMVNGAVAFVYE